MKLSKVAFAITALSLSGFSFATDTRGYNILPVGVNVIDSQFSNINTTQKSAFGLQGTQTQQTLYVRDTYYFNVNGTLGAAYIMLPYSKQSLDIYKPIRVSKQGSGYGDARALFALGLYNMPALSREQFQTFDKNGLHAACSVAITFPTGSYDKLSSTNSGANRYSYKPECAAYFSMDKFQIDLFLGNTMFTDNKEYSGKKTLSQSSLSNLESRLSYTFNSDFWASTDFIYYKGGQTKVNNIAQKDEQSNLNAGVTVAYKIARSQFVKFIYQKTVSGKEHSPQMQDGLAVSYTLAF